MHFTIWLGEIKCNRIIFSSKNYYSVKIVFRTNFHKIIKYNLRHISLMANSSEPKRKFFLCHFAKLTLKFSKNIFQCYCFVSCSAVLRIRIIVFSYFNNYAICNVIIFRCSLKILCFSYFCTHLICTKTTRNDNVMDNVG